MSVRGAFPYVPCPTLDQQYAQRSVGPTPFSSSKTANADYETPALTLSRGVGSGESSVVGCKMSFPASLRNASVGTLRESRSLTNIFAANASTPVQPLPDPVSQLQVPNAVWEAPPQTFRKPIDVLHGEAPLPRDTLHPLISALQAGENAKSAAANPSAGYLADASRRRAPCEAHRQSASQSQAATTASVSGGGAYPDEDDEDAELVMQASRKMKQISHRGDLRTYAGRNFSAVGGFHEPDLYATTVVETASSQPLTLSAMAAKALASALHDHPSHAIPAHVTASVREKPLPNSGPLGGNVNRHQWSGLNNPWNCVVPPPQAFRNLSPELKEVLLVRERDCRHRLARILKERIPVFQPPPCEAEPGMVTSSVPAGFVAQQAKAEAQRKPSDVEKLHSNQEPDPEGLDEISDSELDPSSALGGDGTTLGIWLRAVRHCSSRRTVAEDLIPMEHHPAHATVLSKKLKVLTPQLISMHTSMSYAMQPTTRLAGTGIAMGNTQGQMKPPSASSFLHAQGGVTVTQYSDLQNTPPNAFGFDSERFVTLLSDKGEEVEELFLEGCQWLSNHALASIGRYCVNLKLLNLQDCAQLTDETLTTIVETCRRLCYVNISGCALITAQPLSTLLRWCKDLHTLCMSGLTELDADAELAFVHMRCVPNLTILDVSYCTNITDAVVTYAAEYCRNLSMVDISGCVQLSDTAIASIGASCTRLETLRLKLCTQFSPQGLSRMTIAPRNLSHLDIGGLSQMTPKVLEEVLKAAPRLRRLSISGCTHLDDTGVGFITLYCRSLKYLNISSCTGISMASCMELVHELEGLRWFIVSESSISNAEVVMLSALRESCKIIRNQYRPKPKPQLIAYFVPDAKKKKKADPKDKGKKK